MDHSGSNNVRDRTPKTVPSSLTFPVNFMFLTQSPRLEVLTNNDVPAEVQWPPAVQLMIPWDQGGVPALI